MSSLMVDGQYGKRTILMKIGAIIQARVSSTRLPNKVLLSLPYNLGIPVLEHIIRRTKKVDMINEIIVATTVDKNDERIELLSKRLEVRYYSGDEFNVLSRFYFAAQENNLGTVVRLTGDNPCIDYNVINSTIESHVNNKNDYTVTKGYPAGLNIEVISFTALEKAFNEADKNFEREHVTPYICQTNPDLFKITTIEAPNQFRDPDIRITLDTEEDYALLCSVFDYLYPENEYFCIREIIDLFNRKPWLKLINKKIVQKKSYDSLEEELNEITKICDLQDLHRAKEFLERRLHEGLHNN